MVTKLTTSGAYITIPSGELSAQLHDRNSVPFLVMNYVEELGAKFYKITLRVVP